ncbi:hypothetical protein ACR9JM_08095, partial [Helicobacter pylori]
IVLIDKRYDANVNSDEINHASENYDGLKDFIKHFQAKHHCVSLLELASYKTRDTNSDKDLLLDFVGL